jgi:hypothetical protein
MRCLSLFISVCSLLLLLLLDVNAMREENLAVLAMDGWMGGTVERYENNSNNQFSLS